MRYISHLDLNRLFMRALRRSALPYYVTGGFNPHPRLSFKKAYKLGEEVESGKAKFYFTEEVSVDKFVGIMNRNMPAGIKIFV